MFKKLKYTKSFFWADLIAGLTTAMAAISLGAAFGEQSGRGVVAGMIGASLIPIITSIFGGTRLQASGPTAPMTAVTILVVKQAYDMFKGNTNLADQFITLVFILMGLIMILGGIFKLGRLISFVPQLVIIGFMNGIAVLIWSKEIAKIFGVENPTFWHRFIGISEPINKIDGNFWQNSLLVVLTLLIISSVPFLVKKFNIPSKVRPFIPGTLIAIFAVTVFFTLSSWDLKTIKVETSLHSPADLIAIPGRMLPTSEILKPDYIWKALPFALNLAVLAYLDSLLTSLVIDKITKEETKKEKELVAQGLSNIVSGLFGGIAGAQATIRSVILLKEGAKTRIAGVWVGLFALAGIFILKDYLGLVASAIFVGVLIKSGWDVVDQEFLGVFWKNKKKYLPQFLLVVYVTLMTMIIDLNVAVISGTIIFYILKKANKMLDFTDNDLELSRED